MPPLVSAPPAGSAASRTRRVQSREPIPSPTTPEPPADQLAGRFRCGPTGEQWWSPELYRLHGHTPGAAQPSAELMLAHVHPDDRARVEHALAQALDAGRPFAVEHRVQRPDGSTRTAVLFGEAVRDAAGAVTGVDGLVIDVTDGRATPATDPDVDALTTEVEQLRAAMASRAAIEQAKGVVMLLMGCSEQVAFDLLAHISSHTHRKVRDVAGVIVASASGGTSLPADIKAILHDAVPPAPAQR